jgi:nucleotide-binding universal stress UspA family protein
MFKRIVVAVDGSEHSHKAVRYARGLAEKFSSDLWIVHAFPATSDLLGYDDHARLVSRRKSAGQVILDEAHGLLGETGVKVEEELLEGPEAEAILAVAEVRQIDLIVMGTRGRGSLKGLLFGSVSHKVATYASCPVMVVR